MTTTNLDELDRLHKRLVSDAKQHPSYPEGSEALSGYSEGVEHALETIRRRRDLGDYSPAIEAAMFRQGGVHEWQAEEGSTEATMLATIIDAQVEATLALAYEQRTANLIAVWESDSPLDGANYKQLGTEIRERLGLK